MFGAVNLTKPIEVDLYKCSGYDTRFDRKVYFSISDKIGRSVIIFGVDMSSSQHIDNKKKYIFILDNIRTQGLVHTLNAENLYSINFV